MPRRFAPRNDVRGSVPGNDVGDFAHCIDVLVVSSDNDVIKAGDCRLCLEDSLYLPYYGTSPGETTRGNDQGKRPGKTTRENDQGKRPGGTTRGTTRGNNR